MKKIFAAMMAVLWTIFLVGCSSKVMKLGFIGDIMAHDVNFKMKDYSVM
jgi:hypothetical protein